MNRKNRSNNQRSTEAGSNNPRMFEMFQLFGLVRKDHKTETTLVLIRGKKILKIFNHVIYMNQVYQI